MFGSIEGTMEIETTIIEQYKEIGFEEYHSSEQAEVLIEFPRCERPECDGKVKYVGFRNPKNHREIASVALCQKCGHQFDY
jgi:hypothetical protein